MSRMPLRIWAEEALNDRGTRFWSGAPEPKRGIVVPWTQCSFNQSGTVELAVEDIPGFGYGEMGSIEAMRAQWPAEEKTSGYAAFYAPDSD